MIITYTVLNYAAPQLSTTHWNRLQERQDVVMRKATGCYLKTDVDTQRVKKQASNLFTPRVLQRYKQLQNKASRSPGSEPFTES